MVRMLHTHIISLIFMKSLLFLVQIQTDFWLYEDIQFAVRGYVGPENCPILLPYPSSLAFLITIYYDQSIIFDARSSS